jgi:hypothetical protein
MTISTKHYQVRIEALYGTLNSKLNSTGVQSITIFDTRSYTKICEFVYIKVGNDASLFSIEPSVKSENLLSSNTLDQLIRDKEIYIKLVTSQHIKPLILNEIKQFSRIILDNPTVLSGVTVTREGSTDESSNYIKSFHFNEANVTFMYCDIQELFIRCKLEFNFDTYSELDCLLTSFHHTISKVYL